MTSAEIRELVAEQKLSKTVLRDRAPLRDVLLAEIAAQLATLNERLKPGNLEVNTYNCDSERAIR